MSHRLLVVHMGKKNIPVASNYNIAILLFRQNNKNIIIYSPEMGLLKWKIESYWRISVRSMVKNQL